MMIGRVAPLLTLVHSAGSLIGRSRLSLSAVYAGIFPTAPFEWSPSQRHYVECNWE